MDETNTPDHLLRAYTKLVAAQNNIRPNEVCLIFEDCPVNRQQQHYWLQKWERSKGDILAFSQSLDSKNLVRFLRWIDTQTK